MVICTLLRRLTGAMVVALLLSAGGAAGASAVTATDGSPSPVGLPPELSGLPSLTVSSGKTEAYPGEEIPVTVTVGYPSDLTVRDIQYPRILHSGLTLRETGSPFPGTAEKGGSTWMTLNFPYLLSGSRPGRFILGPTSLECTLLLPAAGSSGFFDAPLPQRRQLKQDGFAITILPFPTAGRPAGFNGAVGDFSLAVGVRPIQVTAGDPVTVTSTVSGSGALATVLCPTMATDNRFRTYPPRSHRIERAVVCEQLLIPADSSVQALPTVAFTFFDSAHGSYRTVRRGPFPLRVTAKLPPSVPAISGATVTRHGSDTHRHAAPRSTIPLVFGVALLTLLATLLRRFRRKAAPSRPNGAGRSSIAEETPPETYFHEVEARLAELDTEQFHTAVFRLLQQCLGRNCSVAPQGITEAIIETHLRPGGCSDSVIDMVRTLFSDCDRVRYGDALVGREGREAIYLRIKELQHRLETSPDRGA